MRDADERARFRRTRRQRWSCLVLFGWLEVERKPNREQMPELAMLGLRRM
jgi:hypothetical protein